MYITFKPGADGISGLMRLIALSKSNPSVRINDNLILLLAVIESGEWQRVSRTVTVYGMMHAHPDLLTPLARDVESVKTGDHFASGLWTSKEIRRQEATRTIIDSILAPKFLAEVSDWGLTASAWNVDCDGLPGIEFRVSSPASGRKELVNVILDGWSGRMAVNKVFGDVRCSSPTQVQDLIRSEMMTALEAMTATSPT
jgi:hypothetical protein